MGDGNEGFVELDCVRGFKAIRSSQDSSSLGDLVGDGKDRKMGEVAKKDHMAGCQRQVLFWVAGELGTGLFSLHCIFALPV